MSHRAIMEFMRTGDLVGLNAFLKIGHARVEERDDVRKRLMKLSSTYRS